jgi:hypothetical protein
MQEVDAWGALVRNALVVGEPPSAAVRRFSSAALRPPAISAERREEYEYELMERAGFYMDGGLSQAEADRLALDDLGCVEYWDMPKGRLGRARSVPSVPVGHCTRCESVGHYVEMCPFSLTDVDVLKVAARRRERRALREVAA